MKWIKTYEELTPKIYRDAGQRFMNMPHKVEKGRKLKDYGSEKEWGVYNIELVKNYSDISRKVKFTKPKVKFILNRKETPGPNDINTRYEDISVEEMLDLWSDAERELYFTIQFYFEPLEETKSRMGNSLPGWDVPLFSFKINMSNWDDGLENWNNPDDWDEEDAPKQYTLQELYDECGELNISLTLPQSNPRPMWTGGREAVNMYHYGIFSDRNSAFRFKKLLPSLIDDEIEGEIWKIFSLLGDSKNFQRCIHALKYGIKVNHLYDDVETLKGSADYRNPNSKWFRYNIADIPREVPKKEEIKEEEPKQLEEPKEEPKPMWYQSRT
jgi:hypothetical protein